jgi:hypothetical protein
MPHTASATGLRMGTDKENQNHLAADTLVHPFDKVTTKSVSSMKKDVKKKSSVSAASPCSRLNGMPGDLLLEQVDTRT